MGGVARVRRADRKRIMMVAGEASGDLHGAALARALHAAAPVRLYGLGGPQMRRARVRILFDPTRLGSIGWSESLRRYPVFKRLFVRVCRILERTRPDCLVLIDSPAFNMRLAEVAHQLGIPAVYYFAPTAWAYGRSRAERVARSVRKSAPSSPLRPRSTGRRAPMWPTWATLWWTWSPGACGMRRPSPRPGSAWGCPNRWTARTWEAGRSRPPRPSRWSPCSPGAGEQEIRTLLPVMLEAAHRFRQEVPGARFFFPWRRTWRAVRWASGWKTEWRRPPCRSSSWWGEPPGLAAERSGLDRLGDGHPGGGPGGGAPDPPVPGRHLHLLDRPDAPPDSQHRPAQHRGRAEDHPRAAPREATPRRLVAEAVRLHREPAAREAQRQGTRRSGNGWASRGWWTGWPKSSSRWPGRRKGARGRLRLGRGFSRPGAEPRDGAASRGGDEGGAGP